MIDIQEMKETGTLLTLDQALEVIGTTEPMEELEFQLDGSDDVVFTIPHGWNEDGMKEAAPETPTPCTVRINGSDEVRLTKEALLTMTSAISLTKDYVMKSPGPLTAANLNWHVKHGGVRNTEGMRLLSKNGLGVAFQKEQLIGFQNLPLIERVVTEISKKYGEGELFADYKFSHSLERTALRIIIPSYRRTLDTARHTAEKPDDWSVGIQFINSLATPDTKTRLEVSGYLFSWWCTNGAISQHATSGKYNRKVQGQDFTEALEWVGSSTASVLGDLAGELDDVQALTEVSLEGELSDVVKDVFEQFSVPAPARAQVMEHLVDSDDLTGYALMQAITQAANDPRLSDRVVENTMRVGGLLPHTVTDRCSTCHRINL